MAIAILSLYVVALALTLAWATKSSGASPSVNSGLPTTRLAPERCSDARRAITYYHRRYHEHRVRMERQERHASHDRPRSCSWTRFLAQRWTQRAYQARKAYAAWHAYHFDWPTWLPDVWQRLGACETGYGRRPGNWSWDSGSYVSAFGIYRPGYADDAHRIGQLSWDETKERLGRLPTPREQYNAALSHYRAHGGFSGWGCRGA